MQKEYFILFFKSHKINILASADTLNGLVLQLRTFKFWGLLLYN